MQLPESRSALHSSGQRPRHPLALLTLALLLALRFHAQAVTTFPDEAAYPLLPGQKVSVYHCEGRILDSNADGLISTTDMRYRVFVPPQYKPNANPLVRYPVILWLHGLGAEGNNNTSQLSSDKVEVLQLVDEPNRYNYPCILVAPQRQSGLWYSSNRDQVFDILESIEATYPIDRKRIYITGVSYGSFGTWGFLTHRSVTDRFQWAAGVAIAGNGSSDGSAALAGTLAGFPLWVFHAQNDTTVDVYSSNGSDVMVNKIRQAGGSPIYTRFASGNHSASVWHSAYGTPALLPWLMSQRLETETVLDKKETTWQQPDVCITGYRVGTTLEMEGILSESGTASPQVNFWNSKVTSRTASTTITHSGSTVTFAAGSFTAADVGSKLFLNSNAFDTWTGYMITSVVSSTQVKVSPNLPADLTGSYEVCPPGHYRNPQLVTGTSTWTTSGVTLAAGTNVIGVTGTGSSYSSNGLGGLTSFGGRTVTINYAAPTGDLIPPQLTVSGPVIETTQTSIVLSGSASDNVGVTSLSWTTDHDGSGTMSGSSWTTAPIPLDRGNNIVTIKALDAAGNSAVKILRVVSNTVPVASTVSASTQRDTGTVIDVLPAASDADAQPQALSVSAVGAPLHGTAALFGHRISYMPNPGFLGVDSFSYTVSDGLKTATAQVTVQVTGTAIASEQTWFSQDFSSSSNLIDYYNVSPGPDKFNDISPELNGGTWSIDTGKLKLVRAVSSGSDAGAGMTRYTDLSGPPQFVKMSFDFTLSGVTSTNVAADIDLGNFTSVVDYSLNPSNSAMHNRLSLSGRGNGIVALSLSGLLSPTFPTDGASHQVAWYVNASGATKWYRGADNYLYQVAPNCSSLWLDGVLLWNNIARITYTGSSLADFRIRSNTPNAITITFDNIALAEQTVTFGASNQPPVANDDTVSTSEGVPLAGATAINVLSNDTDPDVPAQQLTISSYSSPTPNNGTVALVSGKLEYTPAPGFFGQDTISYTISDGFAQDSANVSITVVKTSTADDLNSFQIGGVNIGSGVTGGSRVLANGQWEIKGKGSWPGTSQDAFHGELKSINGDFEVAFRITELQTASSGRIGLVAREGFGPGDRMQAISLGFDRIVRHSNRATANGAVSESAGSGGWPIPGSWLVIRREGSKLTSAITLDDGIYQQSVENTFAGLSTTLQVGIWVTGDSAGTTEGRAVVESFGADQSTTLFTQNFDRWVTQGALDDYRNASPNQGQLRDISADLADPNTGIIGGGIWSIESSADYAAHYNGRLKLVRQTTTGQGGTSGTNGAGFTRLYMGNTPQKLAVSFRLSLTGVAANNDIGLLDIGPINTVTDYSGSTPNVAVGNRLVFKAAGTGQYKFLLNALETPLYPANGTELQVQWYISQAAGTTNYFGPDGTLQSLAQGTSDLWINGTKITALDNAPKNAVWTGSSLGGCRFRVMTDQPVTVTVDNLDMTPIQ